jgi:hypothetical protein
MSHQAPGDHSSHQAPNPFSALGEMQIAAPVKAKHRIAEARARTKAETPLDKELRERSKLMSGYRRHLRQQWAEALLGPRGHDLAALKRDLKRFGPNDAAELVAHVEALTWPCRSEYDIRRLAFRIVTDRIERIRKDLGLPVFDDSLPSTMSDEPDCAVIRCKTAIFGGAP